MPLRIGLFYPSSMMANPVNPDEIWTSSRGLTGSELTCFMFATELAKRGHSVTVFSNFTKIGKIGDVICCHYGEWASTYHSHEWNALCSFMTPEPLKIANPSAFRLFDQQVSDFKLCEPGWESYVDLLCPLSHSHARYMRSLTSFPSEKWRVINNGVDTSIFKPGDKIPGKMVWASSHDRGLHWLLEAFPKIKRRVPHAELHVFYNFAGLQHLYNIPENESSPHMRELGQRSRYTVEALHRLREHGVFARDSVSREIIRDEMASAELLAYPCDPVHYTETFGVTVLEACASGAVPVLCAADAFDELWSEVCPNVPAPYSAHKQEYEDLVVNMLTDDMRRKQISELCIKHAKKFEWANLVCDLETCLTTRGKHGFPEVCW